MNTLSERIRWLIQHFNLSQTSLARLAGVTQPSVANWVNGRTRFLKSEPAIKICQELPVAMDWLVNGNGEPLVSDQGSQPKAPSNVEPVRSHMKRIPVLSYVQAGTPTGVGQIQARQTAFDNGDFIWVDEELPDECFALKVTGSSMEPDFYEKDVIVIDPTITPCPGDFVVATRLSKKTDELETTFKKYRPRGYDTYGNEIFELIPLNIDYPTYNSGIDDLKIVGVLVEHRRSYRRRK
jgi:SOS-response transcriptional repressor LexA